MKKLLFILLFPCFLSAQSGFMGLRKSSLHDLLLPTTGVLIIPDTQTVNGLRSWAQEGTMFYDSATSNIKLYFTGGADSAGSTALNNKLWYVNTSDFTTFTSPIRVIGQGWGGAPIGRRAMASWVGKSGGRYFALALNGYPTLSWPGQDANIYGYTSTDGITWIDAGMKFNKATAWSSVLLGFGNTGVCVDQYNNPLLIGGKYISLIDAWNGSAWITYRATADSLMGNWTVTDSCTSLKVGSVTTYGSSQIIYNKGTYYCFYLYGAGGATPSKLVYATSANSINWTVREAPFMGIESTPFGVNTDQIADVNICEINGKVYMIAGYNQNSPTFKGQIWKWVYNGTFDQMVIQTK